MLMEVKIPKSPVKLVEVKPGLWVADRNQEYKYYGFEEVPEVFKQKKPCPKCGHVDGT